MKIFFLIAFIFICCSNSENNIHYINTSTATLKQAETGTDDSLKKYSYLLVAIKNETPIRIATCFFVRNNNKLFLVSCYHVFTLWNIVYGSRDTQRFDTDTLSLRLFRKDNNQPDFIDIDIREIKKKSKMQFFYDKPDIYCYDITGMVLENKYKIYPVHLPIPVSKFQINNGQKLSPIPTIINILNSHLILQLLLLT